MRAGVSDILHSTDLAEMGSTAPAPTTTRAFTNGTTFTTPPPLPLNSTASSPSRPAILHLGDDITYNRKIFDRLASQFNIIHPSPADLDRHTFKNHLRERTWGNFSAIIKPSWSTGGEMHPWDEELIDLLPLSMKVMAGAGAGFDWVDVNALAKRGILYCNGAHASTESVTNLALQHLISVFNHATYSLLAARSLSPKAFWEAHTQIPRISHNPSGHTLGIVGLGKIGYAIAEKAKVALGMKIRYYDVMRKPPEQETKVGATFHPTLESLLPHCDALLLATPSGPPILTPHTISLLPRGARIVNIARGSLIDEEALADALDSGHISAAALDVHAGEANMNELFVGTGQIVNERFVKMRQVVLTCHTAGASVETNEGFERSVMENVEAVLVGKGPLSAVNSHLIAHNESEARLHHPGTTWAGASGHVLDGRRTTRELVNGEHMHA
ncbi:MAG: hypothetical protein Q9217_007068 [Psora testacea]